MKKNKIAAALILILVALFISGCGLPPHPIGYANAHSFPIIYNNQPTSPVVFSFRRQFRDLNIIEDDNEEDEEENDKTVSFKDNFYFEYKGNIHYLKRHFEPVLSERANPNWWSSSAHRFVENGNDIYMGSLNRSICEGADSYWWGRHYIGICFLHQDYVYYQLVAYVSFMGYHSYSHYHKHAFFRFDLTTGANEELELADFFATFEPIYNEHATDDCLPIKINTNFTVRTV